MLNSLPAHSISTIIGRRSKNKKPILVICDLQPDLLGSFATPQKQNLLDALSIVIEAARNHHWTIVYSTLVFTSSSSPSSSGGGGYQKVPKHHKLYGAFAKLNSKLGDKAVHWFLEGWEGSQVLKEPASVAPRPNVDTVVTREQHVPHELIQAIRSMLGMMDNDDSGIVDVDDHDTSNTPTILENVPQKVYLAGAKASGSVQITAQMLMDQGFAVVGIDEAIQDDVDAKRQAIMEHVLPLYGSVISLQEFVEQMGGLETFSKESQQTFVEYYKHRRQQQRPSVPSTKNNNNDTATIASSGHDPTKQTKDSKSAASDTTAAVVDNKNKKKNTYLACNCGRRGHGAKYMELLLQRNTNTNYWQRYPTQIWYEDMVGGQVYHCPLGKQIVDFCDEPEFSKMSMYLLGREWLDEKDKFLEIANLPPENGKHSYMPQTYCWEQGTWKNGLAPPPEGDGAGPWFVKEANKNLGGAAIHIVHDTSEIDQHLVKDKRYVVQAHIRDPLLTTKGQKTHIKFYVLLVCDENGKTWTLYTYKASLLSISPNPWSPTDLSHDTQVTIHRHPEPPQETDGWKQHDWNNTVYQKCKEGTAQLIQRAIAMGKLQGRKRPKSKIGNNSDNDNTNGDTKKKLFQKQFEVFSVDWMPDTHGNVWVLECNFSPAVAQPEFEDPSHRDARRDYLMKHDHTMLQEALEIVLPSGGGGALGENENDKPCDYGQWDFAVRNDWGDGLSEGGSNPGYELKIDGRTVAQAGREDFGDSTNIEFGDCGAGSGNNGGSSNCIPVDLEVRTDEYGDETEFFLLADKGDLIWDEWGFGDSTANQFSTCVERNGCATLDVLDSYGDGIFEPGKVKLTVDETVKFNSGDFDDGIVFRIGDGC